ncbi:MAG: chromosome segregation protein, partial [bacterium]
SNELIKAQEQVSLSKSEYEQLRRDLSQREDRVETFLTQLDEITEGLQTVKQHTIEAQKNLDDLVRQYSRAEDRLNSLSQLNEKQAYFSDSVQKLLGNKKVQKDFNLIGTLADILNVVPRNEVVVERILGEILQTVLVSDINDAVNAKDWLNKQKASQVSFLLIDSKDKIKTNYLNTATDNETVFLLDLLGLSDKYNILFKQVFPNLSTAIVIDTLSYALEFSRHNQDVLVFTTAGEQIRAGKLLITFGGAASSTNVLQLKREIKELSDNLINLEIEQTKAKAQLASRKEKELRLEQEKKEIDLLLRSEEKTLATSRVELSQSSRELERNQQQIKSITLRLEEVEKEIINLAQKVSLTFEQVRQAEDSRQETEHKVEQKKIEIAKLKPDVETANQKLSQLLTINATQQERKKAFTQALNKLEDEKEQLIKRTERISSDLIQLKERNQELKNSLVVAEKVVSNLEKEMLGAKKNVEKAEDSLVKSREVTAKQEEFLTNLRNQIAEVKEKKSNIQIENAQLQSELQNELSENITELLANSALINNDLEDNQLATDVNNAQQLLLETRNKLSDLGPVNMMALEELDEAEQRQTFLQQQYNDILVSIHSTEEALREIKLRSQIKFREAFQKININFSEMFQELFGGGRGEMNLINEEDVLESGIDINAQPPGKKLQNILLLSGGEKAMTALALVLGIFRFRPSPFCVLDEVDAPLDDVNIGRFTEKIKQMSEQTQFLVITHSKRTMEVASSIYGVTMQDPGISKLISVRLG